MTESGWRSTAVVGLASEIFDGPFGSNLKSSDYVDEGARVVRLENIGHLRFNEEKRTFVSLDKYERLKKHTLRPDDVLFSSFVDEEVRVCLFPHGANEPAINKADCFCIRVNRSVCDPRWLASALACRSTYEELRSAVHGATRPRVNLTVLKSLQLRIPPLPEQRRIVAKIDSLSSKSKRAREHLDHIPRLVEKYKQAVLTAAFSGALSSAQRSENLKPGDHLLQGATHPLPESWTWKAIGEVASVAGGLTKNAKRSQLPSRRPYLRVANVYANELRLDDVGTIGCTDKEFEKTKLEPGDLLVVEGNGSIDQIGRVAMWLGAVQDCVHQNHLIRVRCHRNLNPSFALYWLLSPGGRKAIEEKASTTTGLHTLSISKVAQLGIPVPDTMEQAEIVKKIEHAVAWIDRLAAEATSARTLIDRLDQAVLAKAFRGELVPQDPNDEPASVLLERIRAEREAVPAAKPGRGRARRS